MDNRKKKKDMGTRPLYVAPTAVRLDDVCLGKGGCGAGASENCCCENGPITSGCGNGGTAN